MHNVKSIIDVILLQSVRERYISFFKEYTVLYRCSDVLSNWQIFTEYICYEIKYCSFCLDSRQIGLIVELLSMIYVHIMML